MLRVVKTYKDVVVVYNSNKMHFHIWAQCDFEACLLNEFEVHWCKIVT